MTKAENAWWDKEAKKALQTGLRRIMKRATAHGKKSNKSKLDQLTPAS